MWHEKCVNSHIHTRLLTSSLNRLVLGNKCIHMRCVALIDPSPPTSLGEGEASEGAGGTPGGGQAQPKLYFKVASKTYFKSTGKNCFPIQSKPRPATTWTPS